MEVKYEKHYILSEFGEKNQKLIQNTKILIVGIGGIGCQVLTQLAVNGFENIGTGTQNDIFNSHCTGQSGSNSVGTFRTSEILN